MKHFLKYHGIGGRSRAPQVLGFEEACVRLLICDVKKDQKSDYNPALCKSICASKLTAPFVLTDDMFTHPMNKETLMGHVFRIFSNQKEIPQANIYDVLNNLVIGTTGEIVVKQTGEVYEFKVFPHYYKKDDGGTYTTLRDMNDFIKGVQFVRIVDTSRKSFIFTAKFPGNCVSPISMAVGNDQCGKPNPVSVAAKLSKPEFAPDRADLIANFNANHAYEIIPDGQERVSAHYPAYESGVSDKGLARFFCSRPVELFLESLDETKKIPIVTMAFINKEGKLTRVPSDLNQAGAFSKHVVDLKKTEPTLAAMSDDEILELIYYAKHHGDIGQALEIYRDYTVKKAEGAPINIDSDYKRFSEWYDMDPLMKAALESTDGIIIHPWPSGGGEAGADDEEGNKPIIVMIKKSLREATKTVNAYFNLKKLHDEVVQLKAQAISHFTAYNSEKAALIAQKQGLLTELSEICLQTESSVNPTEEYKIVLEKATKLVTVLDYFPNGEIPDIPEDKDPNRIEVPEFPASVTSDDLAIGATGQAHRAALYSARSRISQFLLSVKIPEIIFKQDENIALHEVLKREDLGDGVTGEYKVQYDKIHIQNNLVSESTAAGRQKWSFKNIFKSINLKNILSKQVRSKSASNMYATSMGTPILMRIKNVLKRFGKIDLFVEKVRSIFTAGAPQKSYVDSAILICGLADIDEVEIDISERGAKRGRGSRTRRLQSGGKTSVVKPPPLPFGSMSKFAKPVYENNSNNDYENNNSPVVTPPSKKAPVGIGPSKKAPVGKEPFLTPMNLMKAQAILSRTKNGRNLWTKLGLQTMRRAQISKAPQTKGPPVTEVNIVCTILGSTKKFKLDLKVYLSVLSEFLNYQLDSETFFENMTKCRTAAEKLKVSEDYLNAPYPWFGKEILLKGGAPEPPVKRGRAAAEEEEEEENDNVAAVAVGVAVAEAGDGFGLQNFCSALCPFESEEEILERNTSLIAAIQSQIGRITTLRPSVLVAPATVAQLRELKEKLTLASSKKYTTTICQQYYLDAVADNKSNTSAAVTDIVASISPAAVAAREAEEARLAAAAAQRILRRQQIDQYQERVKRDIEATVAHEKAQRNRPQGYGEQSYAGTSRYGARRSRSRSRNREMSTQERKAFLWNRAYDKARGNSATFNDDFWGRNPYRGRDRNRRTRRRKT